QVFFEPKMQGDCYPYLAELTFLTPQEELGKASPEAHRFVYMYSPVPLQSTLTPTGMFVLRVCRLKGALR
ncbi:hypothetical protein BD311DRAFT_615679, partial [Dichomitus squalens]